MAIKHKLHKTKKSIATWLPKTSKLQRLLIFVIGFAIVGSIALLVTHASGPTVSLEAENGTIAGSATQCGTDSTASNSNCVQFKAAGTGGTQTINCAPNPHLCGFPDATNTGVLPGATLTHVGGSGDPTSGSGWTFHTGTGGDTCPQFGGACLQITGNIGTSTTGLELASPYCAQVNNVASATVTNLKIDGSHCGNGKGVIHFVGTNGTFNISHSELIGSDPSAGFSSPNMQKSEACIDSSGNSSWKPDNVSIDTINCHGVSTCIYFGVDRGTVSITNNYCHQMSCQDFAFPNIACQHDTTGNTSNFDHTNVIQYEAGPHPGGGGACTPSTGPCGVWSLIKHNTLIPGGMCCGSGVIETFDGFNGDTEHYLYMVIDDNLMDTNHSGVCFGGSNSSEFVAYSHNNFASYDPTNPTDPGLEVFGGNRYHAQGCGFRDTSTQWPPGNHPTGSYICGNTWDDGVNASKGADDGSNFIGYANSTKTSCSTSPGWTIPQFTPYQ